MKVMNLLHLKIIASPIILLLLACLLTLPTWPYYLILDVLVSWNKYIVVKLKILSKHITKVEFFIAFKTTYLESMISQNAKARFCEVGLVLFDIQTIISKLDINLQTPMPTPLLFANTNPWVSQTPYNPTNALLQTTFVKLHCRLSRKLTNSYFLSSQYVSKRYRDIGL